MAEPIPDAPRVMAGIGQGIPAGMPQHVSVNRKGKASARANALDRPVDRVGRERPDDQPEASRLIGSARLNLSLQVEPNSLASGRGPA
jgi:hypothetical protein